MGRGLGRRSRSPLLLLSGLWASAGRVSGRRSCSDPCFHFCGLWASAGRVSGRRSCSDPCFNFVGCGLQRGVCRDVGPAPTLASILWAVGFSGRVSGYRSQVRSIFSYVPIVIFLSRSKMQFEGHRSEANLVAHFTSR